MVHHHRQKWISRFSGRHTTISGRRSRHGLIWRGDYIERAKHRLVMFSVVLTWEQRWMEAWYPPPAPPFFFPFREKRFGREGRKDENASTSSHKIGQHRENTQTTALVRPCEWRDGIITAEARLWSRGSRGLEERFETGRVFLRTQRCCRFLLPDAERTSSVLRTTTKK